MSVVDPLSVLALATQCTTAAPAPLVAAVALAETDSSPYAVTVAGQQKTPASIDAAVQVVALALTNGAPVRIGMASVPVSAFEERGVSYTQGFSACSNLSIAGELLDASWQRFGGMQEHWPLAALEYATGQVGAESAFAGKFDAALAEIKAVADELPRRHVATATAQPAPAQPQERPVLTDAEAGTHNRIGWDVFSRDRSRSLLIYSK